VRRMRPESMWPEVSASAGGPEVARRWEALFDKAPRLRPVVDQMLGRQRLTLQQNGVAQVEVERSLWLELSRWLADFEALPHFAVSAIAVTLEDETAHQVDPVSAEMADSAGWSSPEGAVSDFETLVADPAFALAYHCVDVRVRPVLAGLRDLAAISETDWFALLHASARQKATLTADAAISLVLHVLSPGWSRHAASSRHAALRLFLARPEDLRGDLHKLCQALPPSWALTPPRLPAFGAAAHAARAALAQAVGLCARLVAATRERPGGLALLLDAASAPPAPDEVAELFRNVRKYKHLGGFRQLLSLL